MNATPDHDNLSTTRVDAAHPAAPAEEVAAPMPELLTAIAGVDPRVSVQQINSQTLELAAMLQTKQQRLEKREAELNARTARLESNLRVARLKQSETDPQLSASSTIGSNGPSDPADPNARRRWKEEPNDRAISELDPLHELDSDTEDEESTETELPHFTPLNPDESTEEASHHSLGATIREITQESQAIDFIEEADLREIRQHRSIEEAANNEVDRQAIEFRYDELESLRKELRKREGRLDRQQIHTEQMHDEITELHREAVEMRLATEQIWLDIMEEFPDEDRVQRLEAVREKLADHYRMANDTLAKRKDELHRLRIELNEQEQRLRQQRREVQLWADRRYDEVESRIANLSVRERELDQQESEFHRQSLQWQTQRTQYRQQIEELSWKLHESSKS